MKKVFFVLIFCLCFITACSNSGTDSSTDSTDNDEEIVEMDEETENSGGSDSVASSSDNPHVIMEVNGGQKVEMELYPDKAPETVKNFVKLVNDGFYDGLTFHRVIDGFMIQGGDPTATGTGGSDETVVGEFASNGFEDNDLSHVRGTVSMARSNDPNSASSQFFIVTDDSTYLDGDYAAFGKVIDGMDQVDEIVKTETDDSDKPLEDQVIEKMYIVE